MSLSALPDIVFCDTDTTEIERAVIVTYEELTGKTLYPGDPVRLFLEGLAKVVVMQRVIIDTTAKQNLLAFASEEKLDHLGALTGTARLAAVAATTMVQFSRQDLNETDILIPPGTRVGPDQNLMFETTETGHIPAGEITVDVPVRCMTAGIIGNDFLPGQITELIDPVDGISAVENVIRTTGGADIEDDDRFRERIQLSVERYTTAGTTGGYQYFAKTAHQDIADVSVRSPQPGIVDVYVLMAGGALPDQDMLDLVQETLDQDSVIPLTDTCRVQPPELVMGSVEITWFLARAESSLASSVQAAVSKAVDEYVTWQTTVLGRDINPTELIYLVKQAGAVRVAVTAPVHVPLELWQVARIDQVQVAYGGLEA